MPRTSVLVIGGGGKETTRPPHRRKLAKYPSLFECPFDVQDEDDIERYLRERWGPGWYRVYSPGYHERMKSWYYDEVEKKRWWQR